ncbi:MAG: hypothetical protein ABSE67_10255 [Xanthobacteraceae bacterium]
MTSIELRNPTESQPIEITQFIFQSASKRRPLFVIDQVLTQNAAAPAPYRAASEHSTVPGDVFR